MNYSKSYLDESFSIYEWQAQAIKQGIEAVDRGETFAFEDIKKHWEQKVEHPEPINSMT